MGHGELPPPGQEDRPLDDGPATVHIEVVFSPAPGAAQAVRLALPGPVTAQAALQASGLWPQEAPEALLSTLGVGVWGRRVSPTHELQDGDRLEIYRPLTADPKEARRLRYRAQGEGGRVPRARRRGEVVGPVDVVAAPTDGDDHAVAWQRSVVAGVKDSPGE